MRTFLLALRSFAAVFAGYLVIAAGTFLTFELLLGGIGYQKSSASVLALATAGALLSGLAGGLVAAALAGRRPLAHGIALVIPLAFDTSYVIFSGISPDPVWFDLGGSFTLLAGGIFGAWLFQRWRTPTPDAPASPPLPQS